MHFSADTRRYRTLEKAHGKNIGEGGGDSRIGGLAQIANKRSRRRAPGQGKLRSSLDILSEPELNPTILYFPTISLRRVIARALVYIALIDLSISFTGIGTGGFSIPLGCMYAGTQEHDMLFPLQKAA